MSSPIYASSPSSGTADARHRSASFGGPRLDLVLRPSYSLGPFKLGHSLWHTLNYLRSNQSLFPQINITYDETSPRVSPIAVAIQPNLHLIFNGLTQRLVMITLENLDSSSSSTSPSSASSEPSHRPVNLIYNGKLIYSKGLARSAPVALNRSTLHQILGPTYPGRPETSTASPSSLVSSAFGSKLDSKDSEQSEFVITYPGLAFCFALKPNASKEADVDKSQPVSSMHIFSGADPNSPEDVLVSPSASLSTTEQARPPSRSSKGMLSPTAAVSDYQQLNNDRDRAALDTDAIQVRCPTLLEAEVTPGRGVSLHFAKSGASRADSPPPDNRNVSASHVVELLLGISTPQDALCDLGQPQRIFYKEDDRMRIHGTATASNGNRSTRDRASENSGSTDDSHSTSHDAHDSAFFYNYFDLGLDLLFSRDTSRMPSIAEMYDAAANGQPRLEKVVCHTNVPGDALFQRYNRCPWRVVAAGKSASKGKAGEGGTGTFSFKDHFDSTLNAGEDDRGMELDRGTCAEFKGSGGSSGLKGAGRRQALGKQDGGVDSSPERDSSSELLVDLSTRLVGRQGLVLEVGKDGSMVGIVVF
ncbi:hypothetical protein PSEUBRA_004844 [Kalmanozyma brasiliensis GHG001]|uniref:Uncharacterized protein n=1 Tax=Kalmanozyma brasiliensis (strain GHG001) TaxID=1365824 RepID=V5EL98_KALBG|nr:uncharacterized protein PSEUBRA_004844 [Kalmanozyma brasiliensis GHG001]EST05815.1 hypothetical protein PSEUBRA_004844 [Kalmanozyma brasiliensis GHG001]